MLFGFDVSNEFIVGFDLGLWGVFVFVFFNEFDYMFVFDSLVFV